MKIKFNYTLGGNCPISEAQQRFIPRVPDDWTENQDVLYANFTARVEFFTPGGCASAGFEFASIEMDRVLNAVMDVVYPDDDSGWCEKVCHSYLLTPALPVETKISLLRSRVSCLALTSKAKASLESILSDLAVLDLLRIRLGSEYLRDPESVWLKQISDLVSSIIETTERLNALCEVQFNKYEPVTTYCRIPLED
jgi:hypothetical protein